jgi:hypothetical protein
MTDKEIDAALARLEKLGHDPSGWEALYRDALTGALWEVTYPQGWMHGGGPRRMSKISLSDASVKYSAVLKTDHPCHDITTIENVAKRDDG